MPALKKARKKACPREPKLRDRPLLTSRQAMELTKLFKLLANDTRLRILHTLEREGEVCVGDLAAALGMKPQAVSNQLQGLAARGIIEPFRNGVRIHYRIVDPCTISVLDYAWCLVECAAARAPERVEARRAAT